MIDLHKARKVTGGILLGMLVVLGSMLLIALVGHYTELKWLSLAIGITFLPLIFIVHSTFGGAIMILESREDTVEEVNKPHIPLDVAYYIEWVKYQRRLADKGEYNDIGDNVNLTDAIMGALEYDQTSSVVEDYIKDHGDEFAKAYLLGYTTDGELDMEEFGE